MIHDTWYVYSYTQWVRNTCMSYEYTAHTDVRTVQVQASLPQDILYQAMYCLSVQHSMDSIPS